MPTWIWPILAMLVVTFWVLAVLDMVRRRHTMSGAMILAWLIGIIVVPVLGPIVYFLVHGVSGPSSAPEGPKNQRPGLRGS